MNDINKIRKEVLTEDAKMEIIADLMESGMQGIQTVEIHDMSGTFSDEEFEKISRNNCVIIASTQLFYKQYDASTLLRYEAMPRLGNNKIILDYIEINKGTKAYELKYETYPSEG